ncbi:MAG TPA: flagellar export chaperone FliS [Thermoguttaceae bacterium]
MNKSASDNYLVTEVMTATPQKLQLMILDAAIRALQLAKQHWQVQEDQRADECLVRAQQIVGELLSSLNYEMKSELIKKISGVYLFISRSLIDIAYTRDVKKLDEILHILNIERETWRQVCEKLSASPDQLATITGDTASPGSELSSNSVNISDSPTASFSLEA